MAIVIRPATRDDLPAITEIYTAAVRDTTASFETTPRSATAQDAWFAAHGGRFPLFVAVEEERVLGWAALSPYSKRAAYGFTVEDSVYLAPEFCGRGIGALLLERLLASARELEYHVVLARITAENLPSIKLHRRFGFVEAGVMHQVGWKFNRWLDVLTMEALL